MDHSGVSNTALPMYEYSPCWEMPTGARGKRIIVACFCSLWDLRGINCWLSLVGRLSSSWVIVRAYAWRELGGGVTCEKILGVRYDNLFSMVFFPSNGMRITPFGVGTWTEIYVLLGTFCAISSLTCPCIILSPSLSVCLSINYWIRFPDVLFTLLRLLPMRTPLTRLHAVFVLQTGFFLAGWTGCASILSRSISCTSSTNGELSLPYHFAAARRCCRGWHAGHRCWLTWPPPRLLPPEYLVGECYFWFVVDRRTICVQSPSVIWHQLTLMPPDSPSFVRRRPPSEVCYCRGW